MTLDEFFKKKRIDLLALEKNEPALFLEFATHYKQMGEKSFDHTKKYWFNKLRRQFPLAQEIKTEKIHIENPLAEQTVTESLTENIAPAPVSKAGFVPRFKAGSMSKPVVIPDDKKEEPASTVVIENTIPETPNRDSDAKPAYTPGFVPSKTKIEESTGSSQSAAPAPEEDIPKPAYKPRFVPPKPKI